jgi:hypothetical protein
MFFNVTAATEIAGVLRVTQSSASPDAVRYGDGAATGVRLTSERA